MTAPEGVSHGQVSARPGHGIPLCCSQWLLDATRRAPASKRHRCVSAWHLTGREDHGQGPGGPVRRPGRKPRRARARMACERHPGVGWAVREEPAAGLVADLGRARRPPERNGVRRRLLDRAPAHACREGAVRFQAWRRRPPVSCGRGGRQRSRARFPRAMVREFAGRRGLRPRGPVGGPERQCHLGERPVPRRTPERRVRRPARPRDPGTVAHLRHGRDGRRDDLGPAGTKRSEIRTESDGERSSAAGPRKASSTAR